MATVLQPFNDRLTSAPRSSRQKTGGLGQLDTATVASASSGEIDCDNGQVRTSRPEAPLLFRIVKPLDQHCCSFRQQRRAVRRRTDRKRHGRISIISPSGAVGIVFGVLAVAASLCHQSRRLRLASIRVGLTMSEPIRLSPDSGRMAGHCDRHASSDVLAIDVCSAHCPFGSCQRDVPRSRFFSGSVEAVGRQRT
jgi:hypothetical protein